MAYQDGVVGLHAPIKVRVTKEVGGKHRYRKIIDATVGRMIFNDPIPQDLGYVDRTNPENMFDLEIDFLVGKKQLGQIIDRCIKATWHRQQLPKYWIKSRRRALNILPAALLPWLFATR